MLSTHTVEEIDRWAIGGWVMTRGGKIETPAYRARAGAVRKGQGRSLPMGAEPAARRRPGAHMVEVLPRPSLAARRGLPVSRARDR